MRETMNQSTKVSVVIPVYNRERYLCQCVDSICAQTLRDIEIILVDDGSSDSSPTICDEYASRDSRVHVIHKPNAGLGAAYNTGMAVAKGEYIGFVESDDWVEPEMYRQLYSKAREQDVDVAKCLFKADFTGRGEKVIDQYGKRFAYKRLENVLETAPVLAYGHCCHWSAIYRRRFLENCRIQYPERPGSSSADIDFHWQVYTQVKSFYLIGESFYNYRTVASDASVNQGIKSAIDPLVAFHETFKLLLQKAIQRNALEILCKVAYLSAKHHYYRDCHGVEKIWHARRIARVFRDFVTHVKLSLFSDAEKQDFQEILRHPLLYGLQAMAHQKK